MNLMSMIFLFLCVVGFDHFYRGVMNKGINQQKDQRNINIITEEQLPKTTPTLLLLAKYNNQ